MIGRHDGPPAFHDARSRGDRAEEVPRLCPQFVERELAGKLHSRSRGVLAGDRERRDLLAIAEEPQPLRPRPAGAEDLHGRPASIGSEIEPREQAETDPGPALQDGPDGGGHVDGGRVRVGRFEVGSRLSGDGEVHGVAVTRPDPGEAVPAAEQGEPIADEPHRIGLLRPGVDQFHGVRLQLPAVLEDAARAVEVLRVERTELEMEVAPVVQDADLDARRGVDVPEELRPGTQLVLDGRSAGIDGKGVEMAEARRDLAAGDGSKPSARPDAVGLLPVVDALVVPGRDGKLDAFTGKDDELLDEAAIPVTVELEGVQVRVAAHESRRGHLAPQGEGEARVRAAPIDDQLFPTEAVFESPPAVDPVAARLRRIPGKPDRGFPVQGVDDALAHRDAVVRLRPDEGERAGFGIEDGEAAGQRLPVLRGREAHGCGHRWERPPHSPLLEKPLRAFAFGQRLDGIAQDETADADVIGRLRSGGDFEQVAGRPQQTGRDFDSVLQTVVVAGERGEPPSVQLDRPRLLRLLLPPSEQAERLRRVEVEGHFDPVGVRFLRKARPLARIGVAQVEESRLKNDARTVLP